MTVSINITCDTAPEALEELRNLANALVGVAGPAPEQREMNYGPADSKPAPKAAASPPDDNKKEPADPLQSLLDGTIKEIKTALPNLAPSELEALSRFEAEGKDRATLQKVIADEIDSRTDQTGGDDEGGAETVKPSEAKANTGLNDEPEQKAAPDPEASAKASEAEAVAAGHEGDEPEQPSLEDCREIGRKVQRLENGTETLRELLANMGAANLSAAHSEGKAGEFVAGCEKILAEQSE